MKAEFKKRVPLIIAVISASAAILLLNIYLRKREVEIWNRMKLEEQKAEAAKPKVVMGVVIIAKKDIPPRTPITAEDLTFKQLPAEYIQPGAVTSLEQVIGQISSSPISAEEQILGVKLQPPGNVGKSLAEMTPEGKRAVTVPIEDLASIVSLLKPGDYVDIFAFIALPNIDPKSKEKTPPQLIPLFQSIQVLAIGNETIASTGKEKNKNMGSSPQTVTFALTPQEGTLLAFVQENGKIKLSLRSAQDVNVDQIAPADWNTLFKYLSTSKPEGAGVVGPVVEIYRGLQKEIIPLATSNNNKEK